MKIKDLPINLKDKIKLFYEGNKPLFIYSEENINKTELGKEILKDYQVNILNSYDVKRYSNIKNIIIDSISKRNITLMFEKKKERGYIFDDLDIFQKLDKKSYKEIINFLKVGNYYNCKIIVIFNEILYKKKELNSIDSININLGKKSNNNILKHRIDNIDVMKDLLLNKKDINEIIDFNFNDDNVFLLNILENIYHLINKEHIIDIYNIYIYYDYFELFTTQNHIWELKEYSRNIILRYIYLKSEYRSNKLLDNFKYNSYISKSILSISFNNKYVINSYIGIYICLYMINNKKEIKYEKYLENLPKKTLNRFKKIYLENY